MVRGHRQDVSNARRHEFAATIGDAHRTLTPGPALGLRQDVPACTKYSPQHHVRSAHTPGRCTSPWSGHISPPRPARREKPPTPGPGAYSPSPVASRVTTMSTGAAHSRYGFAASAAVAHLTSASSVFSGTAPPAQDGSAFLGTSNVFTADPTTAPNRAPLFSLLASDPHMDKTVYVRLVEQKRHIEHLFHRMATVPITGDQFAAVIFTVIANERARLGTRASAPRGPAQLPLSTSQLLAIVSTVPAEGKAHQHTSHIATDLVTQLFPDRSHNAGVRRNRRNTSIISALPTGAPGADSAARGGDAGDDGGLSFALDERQNIVLVDARGNVLEAGGGAHGHITHRDAVFRVPHVQVFTHVMALAALANPCLAAPHTAHCAQCSPARRPPRPRTTTDDLTRECEEWLAAVARCCEGVGATGGSGSRYAPPSDSFGERTMGGVMAAAGRDDHESRVREIRSALHHKRRAQTRSLRAREKLMAQEAREADYLSREASPRELATSQEGPSLHVTGTTEIDCECYKPYKPKPRRASAGRGPPPVYSVVLRGPVAEAIPQDEGRPRDIAARTLHGHFHGHPVDRYASTMLVACDYSFAQAPGQRLAGQRTHPTTGDEASDSSDEGDDPTAAAMYHVSDSPPCRNTRGAFAQSRGAGGALLPPEALAALRRAEQPQRAGPATPLRPLSEGPRCLSPLERAERHTAALKQERTANISAASILPTALEPDDEGFRYEFTQTRSHADHRLAQLQRRTNASKGAVLVKQFRGVQYRDECRRLRLAPTPSTGGGSTILGTMFGDKHDFADDGAVIASTRALLAQQPAR